ncbi:MAG: nucleoid-associated protein [Reichenbachiella sp.]
MVISSEAILQNLIIHRINDGNLELSDEYNRINGSVANTLVKYLFKPFLKEERFQFSHLDENTLYQESAGIFNEPSQLSNMSMAMAKKLFKLMGDEKIDGDFVSCLFEDCVLDDEVTDVLGFFFFDKKQQYLTIEPEGGNFQIGFGKGQSKILKGILIFNTEAENGYQSLVINKGKGGEEDQIWSAFLRTEKIKDNFFQTQNLIQNIQEFAQQTFDKEENSEKISMINESLDYIKQNDFFQKDDFQEQVLQSPELIERFESFHQEKSEEESELQNDQFEISKPAIKRSKRFIRSVIKLDKNFHVYVHGNRENITRGFDEEKDKHFYTLYYKEEN